MHLLRPSLMKALLLVLVASLFSSVIASAAPITDDNLYRCKTEKVQPGVDGGCCGSGKIQAGVESRGCCGYGKVQVGLEGRGRGCCGEPSKIASDFSGGYGRGCCGSRKIAVAADFHGKGGSDCCSTSPAKIASLVLGGGKYTPPPCETPTVATPTCGLDMPDGSVVGDLPFDTQADYAAGLVADGVTVSAGTYWVTGVAKADNGDSFYRIIVACQYLFVPVDSMQPSFESPWNGEALPTNEVS